jgi:AmiR/NasT family two-component response regulator
MNTRDNGVKPHLLIMDDDRLVLATLGKGLRQSGYRITDASSGEEALRLAGQLRPDLALLDMRMPGISGIAVAEQLASVHGIPFMFLSAYGDQDIVEQATRCGALGYLVKPLDVPQIIPSVEAALARAREIHSLRETQAQLNVALESGRETSMAVGILMERSGLDRKEAFEVLRAYARSRRTRLGDTAAEVVNAVETVNRLRPPKD